MKHFSRAFLLPIVAAGIFATTGAAYATTDHTPANSSAPKPTIVLVHGAFADSSSWSREIRVLEAQGYPVVAVANPLRGVPSDSAYLESVLKTIDGPIVLVGHSYAGMLITEAAATTPNVKALVYVAAYIPQAGESASDLTYMQPGSELVPTNLVTRTEPDGTDIYINPATFGEVYAGGLSRIASNTAAIEQRPITAAALSDAATVSPPPATPKWMVVALKDNAIPTQTQFFMANRAHARIVTTDSGHDVPAAQPGVVVSVIQEAAHSIH